MYLNMNGVTTELAVTPFIVIGTRQCRVPTAPQPTKRLGFSCHGVNAHFLARFTLSLKRHRAINQGK